MAAEQRISPESAEVQDQPRKREESSTDVKPFKLDKWEIWKAYKEVKANRGGSGIDGQTMKDFERDLKGNLYKIWNRMSSGSYIPSAVRRVEIPKASGGTRPLSIPTIVDRIAQTVICRRIEPTLEAIFHPNSYAYRPGRNALDAVALARSRCLKRGWVVEVDIRGFFDAINHDLLMRAVERHVPCRYARMYIRRWLKTSVAHADGRREERQQGTPQGGVISPLLANLFLHYAFDQWIARKAGNIWFERYADDIVCHCQTQKQAQAFLRALERRMEECYLQLHPEKTRIVHCPRPERKEDYATVKFDFLGYEFRPRSVKRKDGEIDWDFRCAISPKAAQSIWETMRSWRFHQHSSSSFKALRDYWVPKIRGWIGYYGAHYASRLHAVLWRFDERLADWLAKKRKLSHSRARASIYRLRQRQPYLFPHWGAQQKWR